MRATLWLQHDILAKIAFREMTVPGDGITLRPSNRYSIGVTIPPWIQFDSPYGLSSHITVAEFTLFNMEGWAPNVRAHYRLSSYPPQGWMWILDPTKNRLVLSHSISYPTSE